MVLQGRSTNAVLATHTKAVGYPDKEHVPKVPGDFDQQPYSPGYLERSDKRVSMTLDYDQR